MQDYELLLDKLQIFEKLYDVIRIVDPLEKCVVQLKGNKSFQSNISCYHYWNKRQMCGNCISMRAFNKEDTFYKIEYKDNNVYMMTAVSIKLEGKHLVVELIKNISKNIVFTDSNNGEDLNKILMMGNLNQLALKDSLTKLYNRGYMDERLQKDLLNTSLKNEPLSLIFADLDYFKKINDTYGHTTGDLVLKEFSKELKNFIRRDNDWVARFGGDEFVICLPNTDLDTAKEVAERIRRNIEKREFIIGEKGIRVTCSFGVDMILNDNECKTVDCIIKKLDKSLYEAKYLGRNRVVSSALSV